jgi:hypothetical protein
LETMLKALTRLMSTTALTASLLAAAGGVASPASANAGADADLVVGPNGTSSTAVATVTLGASNGDGTRAVAFTCEGLSTGDAASTAVRACTLRVNGSNAQYAPPVALPGAAAATGGVSVRVPLGATVTACSSVLSIFVVSPFISSSKCATAIVFST